MEPEYGEALACWVGNDQLGRQVPGLGNRL